MFCDKCGKDNPGERTTCAHCGAEMPVKKESSGFADILSYEGLEKPAVVHNDGRDAELKKLSEKLSATIVRSKKIGLTCMIVSGVCILLAVVALCVAGAANGKVLELEKTIEEKQESEEKETDDSEKTAGGAQNKTGEGKTGEGKTGEGKTGEGETGEGKTGEGDTDKGKTGEGDTDKGKTNEDETGGDETVGKPGKDGKFEQTIMDTINNIKNNNTEE